MEKINAISNVEVKTLSSCSSMEIFTDRKKTLNFVSSTINVMSKGNNDILAKSTDKCDTIADQLSQISKRRYERVKKTISYFPKVIGERICMTSVYVIGLFELLYVMDIELDFFIPAYRKLCEWSYVCLVDEVCKKYMSLSDEEKCKYKFGGLKSFDDFVSKKVSNNVENLFSMKTNKKFMKKLGDLYEDYKEIILIEKCGSKTGDVSDMLYERITKNATINTQMKEIQHCADSGAFESTKRKLEPEASRNVIQRRMDMACVAVIDLTEREELEEQEEQYTVSKLPEITTEVKVCGLLHIDVKVLEKCVEELKKVLFSKSFTMLSFSTPVPDKIKFDFVLDKMKGDKIMTRTLKK